MKKNVPPIDADQSSKIYMQDFGHLCLALDLKMIPRPIYMNQCIFLDN
jgi:hypothetical protein